MDKLFSFKEACENNIKVLRDVNWPKEHYIKMSYICDTPYPRCEYHIPEHDTVFTIPISGFSENEKVFTFEEGISSYGEYFDKYAYEELSKRINKIKKKV